MSINPAYFSLDTPEVILSRLFQKVCIITGTGGSMGRAAALSFAREGALVVGCDVCESAAKATENEVKDAGGEMVSMLPCDLTKKQDSEALVQFALTNFGRIDVLYNNAAMAYFGSVAELPIEDWHRTINEELNLVWILTQAAWPELVKTGGTIINIASISAWQAYHPLPAVAHAAAKGAVLAMTRQLAMEGAPHGIRANTISPGLISTNQTRAILSEPDTDQAKAMLGRIMLGRPGTPEEVALTALFMASDESSFITGSDVRVDGGTSAW